MEYKNELEKGSLVRCVNNGGYSFLTTGKVYKVIGMDEDSFEYICDDGDTLLYWLSDDVNRSEKFEIVKDSTMQTNNSNDQVKPDEFRVGDRVWCVLYGAGEVSHVSSGSDYPIEVVFEGDFDTQEYTKDGRYYKSANRTLFFSEPKIEASVTRPFVPTLVGKMVVVKEPACHPVCIKIEFENQETFGGGSYSFRKALVEVYEVSSENLLKS